MARSHDNKKKAAEPADKAESSSAEDSCSVEYLYDSDTDSGASMLPYPTQTSTVLFGAELNALQREHRLTYHGLDISKDSSTNEALIDPEHVESSRFFVRQLVLGRDARKGERNVLEVEASNYDGDLIRFPVACLTLGLQEMATLDLEFDVHEPVTLYLSEGSGPLTITGKQQITYVLLDESNDEFYYEDEEETMSDIEEEEEISEEEKGEITTNKKRKRSSGKAPSKKKPKRSAEGDDSEDDDEEEDDSVDESSENELDLSERDLRLLLKQKKLEQQQLSKKNPHIKTKPIKRLKSPKNLIQTSKAKARAQMQKMSAKLKAGK